MSAHYELAYASVLHQRVTQVRLATEELVRHWCTRIELWSDVARVRATAPDGRVLADVTIPHRITTDADRELVQRLDRPDHSCQWPPPSSGVVEQRLVLTNPEVCNCGHGRSQHASADGSGSCAVCATCKRFWRRKS